jgi:hypothetical protein
VNNDDYGGTYIHLTTIENVSGVTLNVNILAQTPSLVKVCLNAPPWTSSDLQNMFLHCPLKVSVWYLLTQMPFGTLDSFAAS